MPPRNFTVETDADGIALIVWNAPDRSANLIDLSVIEELSALVEQIRNDGSIKGAVIASGKETFCLGADLTLLERLGRIFAEGAAVYGEEAATTKLFEESRKLSQLYRRMEKNGK